MKVFDLNRRHVTWNTSTTKWPMKSEEACRSKLQYKIGQIIRQKYPFDCICEDITIPNCGLSLDFFLPQRKLVIEVQGEQHYKRSSFFHKDRSAFYAQQTRDHNKQMFCEINNLQLIYLHSDVKAKEHLP